MNMEKTTERYPIRYYSIITVAKDFISQANGPLAEGTADWKAADKELNTTVYQAITYRKRK